MNALENWFCSSRIWRRMTERTILPWLLDGAELGEHALEIGAGAGAATAELRRRAGRVTSLEYSRPLAVQAAKHSRSLAAKSSESERADKALGRIVQGDAMRLPFAAVQFSAVLAVLMLHHLPSAGAQDCTFREAARVLRPGGVFVAFEIHDRWLQRVTHIRSTFTPLHTDTVTARLTAAGFASVRLDTQPRGFRVVAKK
jgi:SAM-dependent methyltransferase